MCWLCESYSVSQKKNYEQGFKLRRRTCFLVIKVEKLTVLTMFHIDSEPLNLILTTMPQTFLLRIIRWLAGETTWRLDWSIDWSEENIKTPSPLLGVNTGTDSWGSTFSINDTKSVMGNIDHRNILSVGNRYWHQYNYTVTRVIS